MARDYKFKAGDRVRIHATPSASLGCKEHAGEVHTIITRCKFTWAYELEGLEGLWHENCLRRCDT